MLLMSVSDIVKTMRGQLSWMDDKSARNKNLFAVRQQKKVQQNTAWVSLAALKGRHYNYSALWAAHILLIMI